MVIVMSNINNILGFVIADYFQYRGVDAFILPESVDGSCITELGKILDENGDKIDMIILAAYSKILPADITKKAFIVNIHPGLLPETAGMLGQAAQLHAVNTGATGVTIHRVDEGVDTGEVLSEWKIYSKSFEEYSRLSFIQALSRGPSELFKIYEKHAQV